jgi:hypothetical protein
MISPISPSHRRQMARRVAAAGALWLTASLPAFAQQAEEPIPLSVLAASDQSFSVTGEEETLSIPFHLPANVRGRAAVLRLAYENAVHILPGLSQFRIALNGLELGNLPLTGFEKPVSASINMPAGYLRPGLNELTVNYSAHHRVSCSVAGTFELWMRLLPERTSVEILGKPASATPILSDAASILAMASRSGRELTILSVKADSGADHIAWGADIAQGIALRLGDQTIIPKSEPTPLQASDGDSLFPGLDRKALGDGRHVLAGTADQLTAIVGPRIGNAIAGPYLGLFPVGNAGGIVLVVSGRTPDEVTSAAKAFANPNLPLPTTADTTLAATDTAALPDLATFPKGRAVALSELGYRTREFNGYRFTQTLAVTLAPDFFNLDSRKAILRINAASAPGIGEGAALSVFVNGQPAAALPLSRMGEIIERRDLHLPMSLFRPGRNEILLAGDLPPAEGAPCLPEQSTAPRFSLFSDSTLTLPEYARLAQFPDLGTFARTGSPYTDGTAHGFDLVLMSRSAEEVSAAWTLVARMAQAAGVPVSPRFSFHGSAIPAGDALIIGNHRSLSRLAGLDLPVSQSDLTAVWGIGTDRPIIPQQDQPESGEADEVLAQIEAMRSVGRSNPAIGAGDSNARDRWEKIIKSAENRSVIGTVSAMAEDIVMSIRQQFPALFGHTPREETGLFSGGGPAPTGLLMQVESPVTPSRTWTILTAANDEQLMAGIERLVRRPYWNRLSGTATAWGADLAETRSIEPSTTYHRFDSDLRLSNLRLIAGNLMSEYVWYWTAGLLLLVASFGLVTRSFLSPRQDEKHD